MNENFLLRLNHLDSSYLVLLSLAGFGLAAGILFYIGVFTWVLKGFGRVVGMAIRRGFLLWERWFAWASWRMLLALIVGLLAIGWAVAGFLPWLTLVCALAPLCIGVTSCLAYMYIDLERYEVGRGYKSIHNPLMGQKLARDLATYGHQVGVPLLATATVGVIGGFALFNQGLYETIGASWYVVGDGEEKATFVDFLAYVLINFLRIVDVLNLSASHRILAVTFVQPAAWPVSTLLAVFRMFFTLVLLQQIFASLRLGQLLSETIADFWSPHEPIHERARNALPQYGAGVVEPLLLSLHTVTSLTKEQRDQLPAILAAIGPAGIPALIRRLDDPQEHMRAVAVSALGHLHTTDEIALIVPLLVQLASDPSVVVRQNLVEALGLLGTVKVQTSRSARRRIRALRLRTTWYRRWLTWDRRPVPAATHDPIQLAVVTLRTALADSSAAVRTQAARALGLIGKPAADVGTDLIALLKDGDESVRCEAAESLAKVRGNEPAAVDALIELLQDAAPLVKASAARALGTMKHAAGPAVLALVPLLQDQDETVRTLAAEAIGQIGPLDEAATEKLVEGLEHSDNVVRAQTAQALGTIGLSAHEAAPALVEALDDSNDRVRAKAVEALGKMGEGAAEVAVPSLVRALRDQDNWVSALAAEALGQMGDAADEAVPALMRALRHINPLVRANAAESLGKMGAPAVRARAALEIACADEDGGVRGQALRALGSLGPSTPASEQVMLTGLQDIDPQVRTAAVEAMGRWNDGRIAECRARGIDAVEPLASASLLMPLLEDANDQVKIQVCQVLPGVAGATAEVIDGLCGRLLKDDSVLVQYHAAQALSKLGPAAVAAGGPLLRAARTGEVTVREQAMRAIAMIQPPEAEAAFASGLSDADGEIRKMASAGWMKAAVVPESVIPALVEALRDPEVQVRANAAHALSRLDTLPADAVPLLTDCTTHPNDGLRMNAALALKLGSGTEVLDAMHHLLEDVSLRIRFIAASVLLPLEPNHAQAGAVLVDALGDANVRLRQAALVLAQSMNSGALVFLETIRVRAGLEEEPALRDALVRLVETLDALIPSEPAAAATALAGLDGSTNGAAPKAGHVQAS